MKALPLLLFLVYDLSLLALAWRIASIADPRWVTRRSQIILSTLAIKLYLGALLALVVLFFVPQPIAGFRILLGLLVVSAIVLFLRKYKRPWAIGAPWRRSEKLALAALAIAASLCLAGSAYPLREYDSLHNFNYMISWLVDGRSPYEFAFSYVSFWEAGYIPGLLLGESRHLHIWLSAQALFLYATALYVLAGSIGLDRLVALSVVAAAVFLPWHWGWAAGVPTLKNDTLANAGFLMATSVFVECYRDKGVKWRTGVMLGIAFAFMTVKYSGVVLALPFVVAALMLPLTNRSVSWHAALGMTLLAIGLAFIATGHFFLKNALLYGNPLHPFALSLGPLALPGPIDAAGTSILNNLGSERAWKILSGLDPAGQPHLLLVRVGVLAAIAVLLLAWTSQMRSARSLLLVALFALWGWIVWLVSTLSAGIAPGNLVYLEELRSLRYATGSLGASLVVLAGALSMIALLPQALIAAALVISASIQFGIQLLKYQPIAGWMSPSSMALAACTFAAMAAAAASAAATKPVVRRLRTVAALGLGGLVLFGIDSLARQQPDLYGPLRTFAMSIDPPRTLLYRPSHKSETSFFSGIGYHMLGNDVLATLSTLAVHDEIPPALPTGRDGDLLVMHGGGPADLRFARYKTDFEQRIAGSRWRLGYADAYGTVYRWSVDPP